MSGGAEMDIAVDVIVPAYRGLEELRRCLESVLAYPQKTAFELIVIDDASPEPALSAYLDGMAQRHLITLIRNAANLGFVRTVNLGMALHPERDVVLLNSDTEVANDWLDRLRRGVRGRPDIATATPFSNNATICSYPIGCAENPLPPGLTTAELDRVFARANDGAALEIPTAVGFCMYIRRDALAALGLFDADSFGRGYGEENDFSRRAVQAGWRNVLCADTFVYHAGSVSFQGERAALVPVAVETLLRLHPDYNDVIRHFIAEDPQAGYRHAVDIELSLARAGGGDAEIAPVTDGAARLHVVHDLGGGIARWYEDYIGADPGHANFVLKPYSASHAYGEGLLLYAGDDMTAPLRFWRFQSPIQATVVSHAEYRAAIAEIVREHAIGAVLVSSLIGHALDILDTGLPTQVIVHDFYPLCPAINLYFNGVCQACDDARLADCAAHNPEFNPPHRVFPVAERISVRARMLDLLEQHRIGLVVPTPSIRTHLLQLAPRLRNVAIETIPHGYGPRLLPVRHRFEHQGKLRILVLGIQATSKGAHLLLNGLGRLLEFADLYLVGAREAGELFRYRDGVHLVEHYAIEELHDIVAGIHPDLGLLLSIWPETFSYTLTELMLMGIPPAATDLGGFADRIRAGETGYLFPPDTESMLACLRGIAARRGELNAIRANLLALPRRSAAAMVADYDRLLPAPSVSPDARPREEGAVPDCEQSLRLSRQWKEINSLRLSLEMKDARLREMSLRHNELVGELVAERDSAKQAASRHEAEAAELSRRLAWSEHSLAQLHASTSWALSRPVRWLGMGVRKLKAWVISSR